MKWILLLFLISSSFIYSCMDNADKTVTVQDDPNEKNTSEVHPNVLYKNNCAMCHPYNRGGAPAPPIVSYSIEDVLNYYDGKSTKDSVWQLHKKIQLTREEWERIARQMQ